MMSQALSFGFNWSTGSTSPLSQQRMDVMKRFALMMAMGLFSVSVLVAAPGYAMTVTQLELTGGAVNYNGKYHETLDNLLGQNGTLKIGQFQKMGDLVPSITTECDTTFSLFTSGFTGGLAPSAMISGSSIKVDLSSLFFGASRGDYHQTWKIGGMVDGLYNPDTREFALSWNRLFDGGEGQQAARFFLTGLVNFDTQPVAIPAAMVLYATGALGLGAWTFRRRRHHLPVAA